MPEISLPDIKLPDIRFRDGKLRDMKLPDIDLRDRLPDVDLSKLSLPGPLRDMSMPDVSMPDMHMPDMHMPEMHMPDRLRDLPTPAMPSLRDMKAPKVNMPDFDLSSLDPRRLDLSGMDPKKLRALAPFAKPAPKPSTPWPWVIVAGLAGLFAGWWLATSSATGPAVRSAAERVRRRVEDWRAGRSEWDDAEERTEGFWSSDEGWKQEGSHHGGGPVNGGEMRESDAESTTETSTWEGSTSAAAAIGGTEGDSGDEALGGAGYEPPAGDFESDASNREG